MKKVVCSGIMNREWHKCDERKCMHRELHVPIKGRCGVMSHNYSDTWCTAPGTTSVLDGDTDGSLVTCMTPTSLRKKEEESGKNYLDMLHRHKSELELDIKNSKDRLKKMNKTIKMIEVKQGK